MKNIITGFRYAVICILCMMAVSVLAHVSAVAQGIYYETETPDTSSGIQPELVYRVRQDGAWTSPVKKGVTSKDVDKAGSITNLDIAVTSEYTGAVKYRTYTTNGWSRYTTTTDTSVTKGKIQAVSAVLTEELAQHYDLYYRVHITDGIWLDWACNGQMAGSKNLAQRINAISVSLVAKGGKAPGKTKRPTLETPHMTYRAVEASKTWKDATETALGEKAGRSKKAQPLTGIRMKLTDTQLAGGVEYRVVYESGNMGKWTTSGKLAGKEKSEQAIAGIQIRLNGQLAKAYHIYYRVRIQKYGWLDWAKNGQTAGSKGYELAVTGYQVKLVKKQNKTSLKTKDAYLAANEQNHVIKVNKQMNCITVYLNDKPMKAFVCSTGNDTPVGTFYTMQKYRWKPLIHEVWGQYSTRIVSHILFHSVPYHEPDNKTLLSGSFRKLGTTASAGCIRLTCRDAKWIYDNCKLKTKVIIYKDKDPGPLGKPKAPVLPKGQTWDPTDPAFAKK